MSKYLKIWLVLSLLILFSFSKIDKKKLNSPTLGHFFVLPTSWQQTPEFILLEKSWLKSNLPPYFISGRVLGSLSEEKKERKEIVEYLVQEGDNLNLLSQKFGISVETILWANNLSKNSPLKPGQKLIILPVSGVLHFVKSGDTISEIAKKYQAKVEDIISFNELESPDDLSVGDILIVPGGKLPPKTIPSRPQLSPLAKSFFICPVAGGCKITQRLHWYNAVDFSNGKCGEPILAAAGGVVQKVKYGWNGGAGNFVKIEHPNGVITLYAHLQTIFVLPGQRVSQGEIIGLMGATGRSTGCHLHFGVYGAQNPFAN